MRDTRLAVRQHARSLLRDPTHANAYLLRLKAALGLPGAEPVQGALADLFFSFGEKEKLLKHQALQLVRDQLPGHIARWFDAQAGRAPLPRVTPLATRWSVLARPSTDISTRARRCSADDSKAWADHVVLAFEHADALAQQEFFHHCLTCHDNLAFMLARRVLLQRVAILPPDWEVISLQLEQPRGIA